MFKWPYIKNYHLTGVSKPYLASLVVWQCRLTNLYECQWADNTVDVLIGVFPPPGPDRHSHLPESIS